MLTSRYQYSNLENLCRKAGKQEEFDKQQQLFREMIDLIEATPNEFDEPIDRTRILQSRILMAEYKKNRLYGGLPNVDLLRQASQWSVPTACLSRECNNDPFQCINDNSTLTLLQRTMCASRMQRLIDFNKYTAALEANAGYLNGVVKHRRKAVDLARLLETVEPSWKRLPYLEYQLSISEGELAIQDARFDDAKKHFSHALTYGRELPPKKCFPNYFIDIQEVAVHDCYIDALAHIQQGCFLDARNFFIRWLAHREPAKDSRRFKNILIFEIICKILAKFTTSIITRDDWREVEQLLNNSVPDVAKTTWLLWESLAQIRSLSTTNTKPRSPKQDNDLLEDIANKWRLFVEGARLSGSDRSAGLQRPLVMLTFLDVFDKIDPRYHNWEKILRHNLRHLLLLMVDYEEKRYIDPLPEEVTRPNLSYQPAVTEMSSVEDIVHVIGVYLKRRSHSHHRIFQKAIQQIKKFEDALEIKDFIQAMMVQRELFNIIRSWPHIIKVIAREHVPPNLYRKEKSPNPRYATRVERLWNIGPKETIIDGPEKLDIGAYYYLRPKWNLKNGNRSLVRHERFHRANLPRWLEVFTKNLFIPGHIGPYKFHDWILQFRDEEYLTCCKLFSALRMYDKGQIVDTWGKVYLQIEPQVLRGTLTGDTTISRLGHAAKSGSLNPYYFRQALTKVPGYAVLYQGNEKNVFRDISDFSEFKDDSQKPKNIIFLDDFMGTGGQAIDFIQWYMLKPKFAWLQNVNIYLAVLAGFENAVNKVEAEIKRNFPNLKFNIIVGDMLTDSDKAFSPKNVIWASESECEFAKQWANNLGKELLQTLPGYKSDRDALGWNGCEALIAFAHNVPSNTLPIFWASGMRSGKKWIPLLERHD